MKSGCHIPNSNQGTVIPDIYSVQLSAI